MKTYSAVLRALCMYKRDIRRLFPSLLESNADGAGVVVLRRYRQLSRARLVIYVYTLSSRRIVSLVLLLLLLLLFYICVSASRDNKGTGGKGKKTNMTLTPRSEPSYSVIGKPCYETQSTFCPSVARVHVARFPPATNPEGRARRTRVNRV